MSYLQCYLSTTNIEISTYLNYFPIEFNIFIAPLNCNIHEYNGLITYLL